MTEYFNFDSVKSETLRIEKRIYTPVIMKKIITDLNPYNREISANKVTYYKGLIRRNVFSLNGDSSPFIFDCDGMLLDGQHRMQALIALKKDAVFVTIYGYNSNARFYFDQGKVRSNKDLAHMAGINFRHKFALVWAKGVYTGSDYPNPSNTMVLNTAKHCHDELEFLCNQVVKHQQNVTRYKSMVNAQLFKSPALKALFYEDWDKIAQFCRIFDTATLEKGANPAPILLFNEATKVGKITNLRSKADKEAWFNLTMHAIYCFCRDEFFSIDSNPNINYYPLPFVDNMEDNYNRNRVTESRHYCSSKVNSFLQ